MRDREIHERPPSALRAEERATARARSPPLGSDARKESRGVAASAERRASAHEDTTKTNRRAHGVMPKILGDQRASTLDASRGVPRVVETRVKTTHEGASERTRVSTTRRVNARVVTVARADGRARRARRARDADATETRVDDSHRVRDDAARSDAQTERVFASLRSAYELVVAERDDARAIRERARHAESDALRRCEKMRIERDDATRDLHLALNAIRMFLTAPNAVKADLETFLKTWDDA